MVILDPVYEYACDETHIIPTCTAFYPERNIKSCEKLRPFERHGVVIFR